MKIRFLNHWIYPQNFTYFSLAFVKHSPAIYFELVILGLGVEISKGWYK